MVFVEGGCFEMGDPYPQKTILDGDPDEKPLHTVCVSDYYIGKYEVTRGEFASFVRETGYKTQAESGKRPETKAGPDDSMGWTLADINPAIAKRYGLSETSGVVVTEIRRGGKAEKAGLKRGDIIREIDRKPVKDAASAGKTAAGVKKGGAMSLLVSRDGALLVIKMTN